MLRSRVDEAIRDYKKCKARTEYLAERIALVKVELQSYMATLLDNTVSISGQKLDGMPHGSNVGSQVESLAVRFADGYKPDYVIEKETELQELTDEFNKKQSTVIFVEAWLKALNPKECFVIQKKLIDQMSWTELITAFDKEFGTLYSRNGLIGLKDRALEKIYEIAE